MVGASDRDAGVPLTRPYEPANLLATIMQTLFDGTELRNAGVPADFLRLITDTEPIAEVMG